MSYIVIKSTPSDDGCVHEPVMWTVDAIEAESYAANEEERNAYSDDGVKYNVIETDMAGWLDPCEGQGVYQCGIGGYSYIDESRLDL